MNGHTILNQNTDHFLTFTVVGWLDVFSRDIYRKIIIESLEYCQKEKGLVVSAFVIMSNHVHVIVRTEQGFFLSDVIRDFKKFTSRKIVKLIIESNEESRKEWMLRLFKYFGNREHPIVDFKFWKSGNHPIELVSPAWYNQKLHYIHLNPVRANLVDQPEFYKYSSASNYKTGKGVMKVNIIDLNNSIGFVKM